MPSVPARQRLRLSSTLVRTAAALGAALLVAVIPATPARAEPDVSKIEAQLDKQWEQLEPIIEQYNKVHSALKKNQTKSAELRRKIQPLSLQTDLALNRIGDLAAQSYKSGPSSGLNALLTSGSPTTFIDQLSMLERLATHEREAIADVTAVRDRYDAQKRKLDALIAEQQKQDRELAAKKKSINAEMKRLERLRLAAYGSTTSGGALRMGPCPATYIGGPAGKAVRAACNQIGKPYVWGATGPSAFDCSGLTQFAWAAAGVGLTHYTGAQWNQGRSVSRSQARPGDLVFFYGDLHHVGIYVGNGIMVHAPQAGSPVRMAPIDEMPVAGFKRVG